MIRRLLRVVVRLGLAGGAGFALFKFVQSRRNAPAGMPSGDTSIMPKRSETPLVAPKMLHGLALKKDEEEQDESGDGQVVPDAPAAVSDVTETVPDAGPSPQPAPSPPATEPAAAAPAAAPAAPSTATTGEGAWVDPDGMSCPATHPVKAKLASGIYHLPGMLAYERTTPDRCYVDSASAEADGLRKAKR